MTKIKILPEILSNQIAAGEVVQRPSSVVKELVENSIDAEATNITVEIIKGGKSLIRVSDNGSGLSRDDALLSIERYATSKIFKKEDLFSISTMGFRGEALPSIASISKFNLVTRTEHSDVGTGIEIAGGRIKDVYDTGSPVGTMVEVRNLFFNTPARKKFLKTDHTETSHIIDTISGMALGNPHIQFRLFINEKLYKNFSSSDDLLSRAVNVLGKDVTDKLYKFDVKSDSMRICGLCSNPMVTRSTSSKIFLFVNSRLVYDRGVVSAVFKGYRQRIMKGRFPLGVFFIDIAFDQVDVNVHPSKREIKFFNASKVYREVSSIIEDTLSEKQADVRAYSKIEMIPEEKFEYGDKTAGLNRAVPGPGELDFSNRVEQTAAKWQHDRNDLAENNRTGQNPCENFSTNLTKQAPDQLLPEQLQQSSGRCEKKRDGSIQDRTRDVETLDHSLQHKDFFNENTSLTIIGQALGTYIIAELQNTLMLIDQHAAHERIVYEKLKKRYQSLNVQSQSLIAPEIIELSFRETDLLIEILDDLQAVGIVIEPFGDTTFVVKSVPSIIDEKEIKPIILDILETGLKKKDKLSSDKWLDKCLISMACHGSVRANLTLDLKEIRHLLTELENCENSRHCPHGRPIIITLTRKEIEKLFKRIL